MSCHLIAPKSCRIEMRLALAPTKRILKKILSKRFGISHVSLRIVPYIKGMANFIQTLQNFNNANARAQAKIADAARKMEEQGRNMNVDAFMLADNFRAECESITAEFSAEVAEFPELPEFFFESGDVIDLYPQF